jgi:hypothetical protein
MLSCCMVKNCVEVLKRHVWICISFAYLTNSVEVRMEAFTLVKSFCVSEFGKVEVTSTPVESSFFKALALLKLLYSEFISKNF